MSEIAWFMLALFAIGSLSAGAAVAATFALDRMQRGEARERDAARRGERITP
jgi:hypothetical protein